MCLKHSHYIPHDDPKDAEITRLTKTLEVASTRRHECEALLNTKALEIARLTADHLSKAAVIAWLDTNDYEDDFGKRVIEIDELKAWVDHYSEPPAARPASKEE